MDRVSAVVAGLSSWLGHLGPTELFYVVVVGGVVLMSFALLFRPFAILALTTVYLAIANTALLGEAATAAIAAVLIGTCFAGTVIASNGKFPIETGPIVLPALIGAVAVAAAVNGLLQGNRVFSVLGDFYQISEFLLLFVLGRALITTEQQFRRMAIVLISSIIATSALQAADFMTGAHYVAKLEADYEDFRRVINMNASIAFVTLLAVFPYVRAKWLILALLASVGAALIASLTRGLWLATAVSAVFLLIITPHARAAILKLSVAGGVFAIGVLYASGLGQAVIERTHFAAQQIQNSPDLPTMASRRRLEHIAILPQILQHPLLGNGLGATYRIAGDAVLHGPKGQVVNTHYVHNLYLQIAFRLGLPALLLFGAMLWRYFRSATRSVRDRPYSPENTALMAGMISAVFGEVVLSLTSPTILAHPTAGIVGLMMAMTATRLSPAPPERAQARSMLAYDHAPASFRPSRSSPVRSAG